MKSNTTMKQTTKRNRKINHAKKTRKNGGSKSKSKSKTTKYIRNPERNIIIIHAKEDRLVTKLRSELSSIKKDGFIITINKDPESLKTIIPNKHTTYCKENEQFFTNWMQPKDLYISLKDGSCILANEEKAKREMLKLLHSNVNPKCVIAPKQSYSNCWMNSLFMTAFVSDLGRLHNKWMRHTMITGETLNGTLLKKSKMRTLMRRLNISIQACLDCNADYVGKLDTNDIINYVIQKYKINERLIDYYRVPFNLYGVNRAGNPGSYLNWLKFHLSGIGESKSLPVKASFFPIYENITELIDYDGEKNKSSLVLDPEIFNERNILQEKWHHLIILSNDKKRESEKTKLSKYINVIVDGKEYLFMLDSINIIDEKAKHYTSCLTIKNRYYAFDGASFSRLQSFNWMKYINKDQGYSFKIPGGDVSDLVFNFKKSFFQANYYRIR